MSWFFFDSSAYLKLFVAEAGTPAMIELVSNLASADTCVSALAFVEVRSAIRRRTLTGDVGREDATTAVMLLEDEFRRVVQQPIAPPLLLRAAELVDVHTLRSLDAVQLGSALLAAQQRGTVPVFVSSDVKLNEAAAAEGMPVWNPRTGDAAPR